jgi:hypothetical protein
VETTARIENPRPRCMIFILLITKAFKKAPNKNAMKLAITMRCVLPNTDAKAS